MVKKLKQEPREAFPYRPPSKEVLKKFIFNNYAKIQIQQRKTKNYLIFATGIFVVIVLLAKFY